MQCGVAISICVTVQTPDSDRLTQTICFQTGDHAVVVSSYHTQGKMPLNLKQDVTFNVDTNVKLFIANYYFLNNFLNVKAEEWRLQIDNPYVPDLSKNRLHLLHSSWPSFIQSP